MNQAPVPLFRDPIYDGAADPIMIWNYQELSWWLLYTNRRANVTCQGLAWVHGTDIGIASSADHGHTWRYRGILEGLEFERGRNTFWAPEVVWHEGRYHMYVSYVSGIPIDWSGSRSIIHMTSQNLWDWKHEGILSLSSDRVIDACVFRMPAGHWRMWYKDEAHQSFTYAADSEDLANWKVIGPVISDCPHEGPNVFFWRGSYWMVTDHWQGIGVYRSDDAKHWQRLANILSDRGRRPDDGDQGRHADVTVQGDRAFIVYFTHPGRNPGKSDRFDEIAPYSDKRSSIQVAELKLRDGMLVCDRDETFDFTLQDLPL